MIGQPPSVVLRIVLWMYAGLWTVMLPVVLLYLRKRGKADPLYAQHLGERFGRHASEMEGAVWVHAVSLGEMRSAVPLVRALLDRGELVVCTHFTPAGRREACSVFAEEIVAGRLRSVWVPFEFAWAYRRFFAAFRPKLGLVMEIEIWPRMVFAAQNAGVPLMMCNAQYPSRSMVRDAKWVGLGLRHEMMRGFAGALVKSDMQAQRFADVGVRNIFATGELRFDQPVPERLVAAGRVARDMLAQGRKVVALSSVIEGEDAIYINAMRRVLDVTEVPPLFVYVSRKPERFDEVEGLLREAGFSVAVRSRALDAGLAVVDDTPVDVLLGDSMGEMYFYLSMADRVIAGGGFHPNGAHNIIEPLALRRPVLVGPVTHTIEYPFAEAEAAGVCLKVADADALVEALTGGWQGPSEAQIEVFFEAHAGGTGRAMKVLERVVG